MSWQYLAATWFLAGSILLIASGAIFALVLFGPKAKNKFLLFFAFGMLFPALILGAVAIVALHPLIHKIGAPAVAMGFYALPVVLGIAGFTLGTTWCNRRYPQPGLIILESADQ